MAQRARKLRLNGPKVTQCYSLSREVAEAVAEVAREEEYNNKSAVVEKALIDWLNRRRDVRAA